MKTAQEILKWARELKKEYVGYLDNIQPDDDDSVSATRHRVSLLRSKAELLSELIEWAEETQPPCGAPADEHVGPSSCTACIKEVSGA